MADRPAPTLIDNIAAAHLIDAYQQAADGKPEAEMAAAAIDEFTPIHASVLMGSRHTGSGRNAGGDGAAGTGRLKNIEDDRVLAAAEIGGARQKMLPNVKEYAQ